MTAPTGPVVTALIATLNAALSEQVSDGYVAHPFPPDDRRGWVVVSPLPGGPGIPVMAGQAAHISVVVQITSYGVQRAQAAGVADAVATVLLGQDSVTGEWVHPITGAGFVVWGRSLYQDMRMGVLVSGQAPDLIFHQPDRYVLLVSAA